MQRARLFGAGLLAILALLQPPDADATLIAYQATDLPDVTVGADLWKYDYLVTGTFVVDEGFAIVFPHGIYADLVALSDPGGWDILVLQPDTALPDDGLYDALAEPGASLALPFSVSFTWLGGPGTSPESQAFELYRMVDGVPVPFDHGFTSAVPEPATWMLLGSGLALALKRRRTRTGDAASRSTRMT